MLPITRCVALQAVANGSSGRFLERLTSVAREGVGRKCFARTLVQKSSFELSYTIKLHNKVSIQPDVTAATGLADTDRQKLSSLERRLNPTEGEVDPEVLRPVVQKINLSAVGKSSQMGRRRGNEDRIIALELRPNLLMFGILDGHGGSAAADYVKDHLPKLILDALNTEDNDLAQILKKTFLDVNHYFTTLHSDRLKTSGKKERPQSSGTTATICLIRDGIELFVANVGDSRAVLCQNNECVRLTVDHLPSVEAESARIVRCNGYIAESSHGTPRVNGVLEMTRSIGDVELKPFGVIAEPEVTTMQIQNNSDSFLVLTTDGVHGHLGSDEIITQISSCVDAIEAADHITDQAILFGSEDNCSAVVVPFNAWSKFASTEPRQVSFTNRNSCAIAWCS